MGHDDIRHPAAQGSGGPVRPVHAWAGRPQPDDGRSIRL